MPAHTNPNPTQVDDQFIDALRLSFIANEAIEDAVESAMDEIDLPNKWRGVLRPALTIAGRHVRNEVDRATRAAVAAQVEAAPLQKTPRKRPKPTGGDTVGTHRIGLFERLMGLSFEDLEGHRGDRITWGEATLSQHKAKIGALTKYVDGTERTIRQHKVAVEFLTDTGISSLDGLPADKRQDFLRRYQEVSG
jgi:hypothetical protein